MEGQKRLGKITIVVDEKIPGVFGDYSSLGVAIGLEMVGDVDNFEKEIDAFTKRIVAKIQDTSNEIAVLSGLPTPWAKEKKKIAKQG